MITHFLISFISAIQKLTCSTCCSYGLTPFILATMMQRGFTHQLYKKCMLTIVPAFHLTCIISVHKAASRHYPIWIQVKLNLEFCTLFVNIFLFEAFFPQTKLTLKVNSTQFKTGIQKRWISCTMLMTDDSLANISLLYRVCRHAYS